MSVVISLPTTPATRLLTGAAAYNADERADFERVWRIRPTPPDKLNPVVTKELSDLIVSMISVDPLGRPSSAAEVIDRVRGVGGLARVPEVEAVRGVMKRSPLDWTEALELRSMEFALKVMSPVVSPSPIVGEPVNRRSIEVPSPVIAMSPSSERIVTLLVLIPQLPALIP